MFKIESFTQEFKEHPLKFVKEYIGVFIGIPAVLGGIWQLVALASISPSFIRFYSITQVVADGLLLLIVGSVTLIITAIMTGSIGRNESTDDNESVPIPYKPLTRKSAMWLNISAVIILTLLTLLFQFCLSFDILFLDFLIFVPLTLAIPLLISDFIRKSLEYSNCKNVDDYGWIYIFVLILLLISLFKFAARINTDFGLPSKVKNLQNIQCMTKKYVKDDEAVSEIEYFNDKYLFIKYQRVRKIDTVKLLTEPQYIIFPFEKIVENEYCETHERLLQKRLDSVSNVLELERILKQE